MRNPGLTVIAVLFSACVVNAQMPQIERDALIAVYNATDGSHWYDDSRWLGPTGTECTWRGVSCSGGHVNGLASASGWATVTLPPELADLTQLTYLILDTNEIGGNISPELGSLDHLELLFLFQNRFTGQGRRGQGTRKNAGPSDLLRIDPIVECHNLNRGHRQSSLLLS